MAMAFDPNRWTLRTQEAVQAAVEMARTQAHPEVTPDHLLAALVGQQEGVVLPVLGKVGVAPLSLRNTAGRMVSYHPAGYKLRFFIANLALRGTYRNVQNESFGFCPSGHRVGIYYALRGFDRIQVDGYA